MKDKIIKKIEGWQMIVEIYEDYVIKYPKNKEQMENSIRRYLKSIGREDELQDRINKMIKDRGNSMNIIRNSQIPKDYLANLTFLEDSKIKQNKVLMLDKIFQDLKEEEKIKKIIDDYIEFVILLWKYGMHENTYKMHSNFGLISDKMVLIDPFEITDKKEKVLSQIQRKKWAKPSKYGKNLSRGMINYLINKANETWTEEKLNKVWGLN